MLGWLWKRGMRAVVDLHGLPGSQSGDANTGEDTTHPVRIRAVPGHYRSNNGRPEDSCADVLSFSSFVRHIDVVEYGKPETVRCNGPSVARLALI